MKTTPNEIGQPPICNLSMKENQRELTHVGVQCDFLAWLNSRWLYSSVT